MYTKSRNYTRREFSNAVMRANAIDMTAEEFAQAVGQPLETILRRAKEAGIQMRREGFAVARDVRKATQDDPRVPCVVLRFGGWVNGDNFTLLWC